MYKHDTFCLNSVNSFGTDETRKKNNRKLYIEKHRDEIKDSWNENYEKNRQKIIEQKKEYQKKNHEKLTQQFTCQCGSVFI